jgi:hypothetical protein
VAGGWWPVKKDSQKAAENLGGFLLLKTEFLRKVGKQEQPLEIHFLLSCFP